MAPRKRPRRNEWSDDEIVLALATCPRRMQSYGPRDPEVIELADLLHRTPSSVSRHFANISHLIHRGDHGMPHVGQRFRDLFDLYLRGEPELQKRAKDLRRSLTPKKGGTSD